MNYVAKTWLASIGLCAIYGLLAPLAALSGSQIIYQIAGIVTSGVLIAYWYRRDAEQFKVCWSPWWLVGMLWPAVSLLVFPWHFFRTRGFVGGLLAILGLVTLSVVCGAVLLGAIGVANALAS